MIKVVLKGRVHDSYERTVVHDYHMINNALTQIVKGLSVMKSGMWYAIANSIELAAREAGYGKAVVIKEDGEPVRTRDGNKAYYVNLPDFEVEINNTQADVLFGKLKKLKNSDFGELPPYAIGAMLTDLAAQLGKPFPLDDDSVEDEDV